ncbi:MAG: putative membrane protein [Flavobacterium sp.]|jgi:uncharacterized membrane protein
MRALADVLDQPRLFQIIEFLAVIGADAITVFYGLVLLLAALPFYVLIQQSHSQEKSKVI